MCIFKFISFIFSTIYASKLLYIVNGDDMRKKFRSKKRLKKKYLIFPIFIFIIISIFSYIENHITITLKNNKTIDTLWKSGNEYSYGEVNEVYLSLEIYKYIKDNIFNSPINILKTELRQEDKKSNNEVISFTYVENEVPLIYIYNSHQGETYSTKYLEDYNIVPDVKMAASMLKDKLENIGIPTLVENSDILKYMKQNNLNHAGSYIASRYFLENTFNKYPNMELYIDLHRDAAPRSATLTTIDGKQYAKVLFVIGLEYDTYEKNLSIATQLNNIIKSKYPTLTRGILKKQGYGVNGVYNQDLNSNVILIEIGGNENNIEEVNNTLDKVAETIGEYINEKKQKK